MAQPVTNVEDLRHMAQRRIPRAIFDYADHGSYDERTLRANRDDLAAIKFRQRVMIDVSSRSTGATVIGEDVTLPVILAPTGLTGLFHGNGEILAARAAHGFGTQFCLSTFSICSLEDVAARVNRPFWFQLYVMRDRGFTQALIKRAQQVHCPTLVLTLDAQVPSQRHQDIRNGLNVPPRLTLRSAFDAAMRPAWALKVLAGKRRTFGNLEDHVPDAKRLSRLSEWSSGQVDPSLTWKDVEWVRRIWPGKLVLKGIMDAEDARIAAQCGADAIVVSNHGGRQLDGAPSSISVLPEVSAAVGDKIEILFDGGVRSGQDVLKALALGARACLIGKAFLYGLAAMGEKGVSMTLDILRRELDVSMGLTGLSTVQDAGPHILKQGTHEPLMALHYHLGKPDAGMSPPPPQGSVDVLPLSQSSTYKEPDLSNLATPGERS